MKITRKQLRRLIEASFKEFGDYKSALSRPSRQHAKNLEDEVFQDYIDSGVYQFQDKFDAAHQSSRESGDMSNSNNARTLYTTLSGVEVSRLPVIAELEFSRKEPRAQKRRVRFTVNAYLPRFVVDELIRSHEMGSEEGVLAAYNKYQRIVDSVVEDVKNKNFGVRYHYYKTEYKSITPQNADKLKAAVLLGEDLLEEN